MKKKNNRPQTKKSYENENDDNPPPPPPPPPTSFHPVPIQTMWHVFNRRSEHPHVLSAESIYLELISLLPLRQAS